MAVGDAEVHEHGLALGGDDHVGRLDVAVDHGRPVAVEVVEGLGHLAQVVHDVLEREPPAARVGQDVSERRALHPVHHQEVAVAGEEVLPHPAQQGMRLQPQEDAGLAEQRPFVLRRPPGADLEADQPAELVVQGLQHGALAPGSDHLQRLIPVPDELRHGPSFSCITAGHRGPWRRS